MSLENSKPEFSECGLSRGLFLLNFAHTSLRRTKVRLIRVRSV